MDGVEVHAVHEGYLLDQFTLPYTNKCAALTRAAAKHTPRKGNKNNSENQTERRGGAEPSPLNRSGDGCRFFHRAILSLHWFCRYGYSKYSQKIITKYCALGSAKFCKNTPHKAEIEQGRAAYAFRILLVATQKLIPTTAATKLTKNLTFNP